MAGLWQVEPSKIICYGNNLFKVTFHCRLFSCGVILAMNQIQQRIRPYNKQLCSIAPTHICFTRPQYQTPKPSVRHRIDKVPTRKCQTALGHDDVIKWKHFPRNWPFVRGINRSPVNKSHKGQWSGALMFSLICVWINDWANNREAGDLRRYRVHCAVMVMVWMSNYIQCIPTDSITLPCFISQ